MKLIKDTRQIKIAANNLKLFMLVLVFTASALSIHAQDTAVSLKQEASRIGWIAQYPASENNAGRKKLGARIIELVTGNKNTVQLSKPLSVVASSPDSIWILDQGNEAIFRVVKKVGEIPHFWEKKYMDFKSLVWLSEYSNKRLLFTDSYLNKVFVMDPSKKEVKPLNDTLMLEQPTGVAWSEATGEIWVVETRAHHIRIMNEYGETLKVIGKRGNGPSEFNYPTSISIDKEGNAYVVDAMNFRIQVFTKEGKLIKSFGEIGDATGYFARPKGIATDSQGNIYVADALFHTVQIFDNSGRFLYNFGSQGREKGEFWMPAGIFIDSKDFIYVADSYNSRVQVFQLLNGGKNE
jgi:streptogramin lyase